MSLLPEATWARRFAAISIGITNSLVAPATYRLGVDAGPEPSIVAKLDLIVVLQRSSISAHSHLATSRYDFRGIVLVAEDNGMKSYVGQHLSNVYSVL